MNKDYLLTYLFRLFSLFSLFVLFRKVCHSHHSLNHLLPPKRIFTNLRARAGHPFQLAECTTLLHKKSFIVRVLYKHVLPFGH